MTISEETLRLFIDGLSRSAGAQERAAATSDLIAHAVEDSTKASERRQEIILASLLKATADRIEDVHAINRYTTKDMDGREKWWRNSFKMWAGAMVIATLLGVPLGRYISAILGIKP